MKSNEKAQERIELIRMLTGMLLILRAAIGISQGELADCIGISRQTYCALEQGKRQMSWGTFLSLFLFFISNEDTYGLLKVNKGFIARVYKMLQFKPDEIVQYPQGFEK